MHFALRVGVLQYELRHYCSVASTTCTPGGALKTNMAGVTGAFSCSLLNVKSSLERSCRVTLTRRICPSGFARNSTFEYARFSDLGSAVIQVSGPSDRVANDLNSLWKSSLPRR